MPVNTKSSRKNCRIWVVRVSSKDGESLATIRVMANNRKEAIYLAKCKVDGASKYVFTV